MEKKRRDKKRFIRYAILAFAIVFFISTALLLLEVWEKQQGRFPELQEPEETIVEHNGVKYVPKGNIETFLVMGLDKFEESVSSDSYNNAQQADFILLFVLNNETRKCTAIHINRDTMVDMDVLGVAGQKIDTVNKQIALAHTYGNGKEVSCRNTADAVTELLGIKVNHYISFTMDSVPVLNNLVGGVEVTVLDDFVGIDNSLVKGKKVILSGEQALHYVRTRKGLEDSSNSTRMERQKQYLKALHSKMLQCVENDDEFIVNASVKMSDFIVSDRSVNQLQELARKITTYEFIGIRDIVGESKLGDKYIEFYPDENSIKETVLDLCYQIKD